MSKLSLREIAQSQLDSTPVIDGQLIVCLDTGNAYRDTTTAHVKIGSDLEVVSDLPLAPLAEKLYYLKPDKLYVFLGGNWTLLNDKTIDLDEAIAKLPAGSLTSLNDDVEIITQDTDITQPHYYRRKLVVLWEYIKTKAQDFFAAKNHKHGKADITDFPTSMPASDVYPWAKATTKPSYTKAEVGLGKVDNTADADKSVKRATTAGTADSANSVAWENVKDKPTTFPPKAHEHDDRYYTEAEVDGKLEKKSPTDHTHDLSELISNLSIGTSTKLNDAVQIITQDTDTANQKYYRRPLAVLWDYIKSKADNLYSAIGHNHKIQNLEDYTTRVWDATIVRQADTVLASPQDKDGIATFRKLDKNDVGLENVDNTADKNKNVATARGISVSDPVLATGVEYSEITGKINDNKSLGTTATNAGVLGLRNALDFRWYDTHWQIGNLRSGSTPSAGFGFAFKGEGENSFSLKARILTDGTYTGNISGNAATADTANTLSGFSPRSSQTWGVQTGTFVHGEGDSTGGDFAFRRDCPNAGQVSMVLDGRFYQNEGQYRVLDESDIPGIRTRADTDVGVPLAKSSIDGSVPWSGAGINTDYANSKSMIGSSYDGDQWYNVLSIRHRNGASDGNNYGMLIFSHLTYLPDTLWYRKQNNAGWTENRNILDSTNYSSYALPLSGGTISGALNFANGTWNLVGDDAYMGDHNIGGSFCIMGANDMTRLALVNKDNQGDYALLEYGGGNLNFNKKLGANITGHADGDLPLGGGTLTGDIAFSNCGTGVRQIQFTCADNDFGRVAVGGTASNAGYMEIATADDGNEPIYVRQYSGVYASIVRSASLLDGNGNTSFPGAVTANTYYAPNWFRATGNSGFYFESHGGGWYMIDNTWIRAYNNKNIYTPGVIQCDSGFNGNLNGNVNGTVNGIQIRSGYGVSTSFPNQVCTELGVDSGNHNFLATVRCSQSNNSGMPVYGSGAAWGCGDTQGYIYTSYSGPEAWIGGGNNNKFVWQKQLAFLDSKVSSSGHADTASNAEYLGNDAAYMRMHWNGQGGQPTWLWGGNDASNMYVWNPSNFSVNYANSAGSAGSAGNGVAASGSNYVRFGDGTQICWGQQGIANAGTTITYAVAFSSIPAVVNSGTEDIDDVFFVRNITTTNFVADKRGWYSGNNTWIAIGRWK